MAYDDPFEGLTELERRVCDLFGFRSAEELRYRQRMVAERRVMLQILAWAWEIPVEEAEVRIRLLAADTEAA